MSFATYEVKTRADLAKGTGFGVSLQKTGRGAISAQLVVTLKIEVAASLGWKAGDTLAVQLGEEEHHGLLRLRKGPDGTAALVHRVSGDGKKRGGPYLRGRAGARHRLAAATAQNAVLHRAAIPERARAAQEGGGVAPMESGRSNLVDVTMQLHGESSKAILVSDDGERTNAVWIPLSQCEFERKDGRIVIVTLPEWLAIEKGLV